MGLHSLATTRLLARFAVCLALAVIGPVGAPTPASALTWAPALCTGFADCTAKGYGSAGYEPVYRTSHWGMYGGHNCTNYAAYRLMAAGHDASYLRGQGNAYNWGVAAAARNVPVDTSPKAGDIAWWDRAAGLSRSGHVGYVEAVDVAAGTILVSEDNYSADFDWRVYRIEEVTGFIHFNVPATMPTFTEARAVAKALG